MVQYETMDQEQMDSPRVFGRGADDHERLFPKYTVAQAASTGEVIVNGKNLMIWEFSQLESLNVKALKQRALAIRDAVGQDNCPPIPSSQVTDMVHWILHMQAEITQAKREHLQRNAMTGLGPSPAFQQEIQERPIQKIRAPSPRRDNMPFGPKMGPQNMDATRDHYADLLQKRNEFKEPEPRGIATQRAGGEGRRHIFPEDNMVNSGLSNAYPKGIETLKAQEGRRYLTCKDHLLEQQKELEAIERGQQPALRRPRQGPESVRYGGQGVATILNCDDPKNPLNKAPVNEAPIGGERKRHINPEDHMLNSGIADAVEGSIGHGRIHVDNFAGHTQYGGAQRPYRPTWKQDPSKLMGSSLII
jgi:hypothetical protein